MPTEAGKFSTLWAAVFLLGAASLAGLLWNFGNTPTLVCVHFIWPVVLGALLAVLVSYGSLLVCLLTIFAVMVYSTLVRSIVYSLSVGTWHYVFRDGETQAVLLTSIVAQTVVALSGYWLMRSLQKRTQKDPLVYRDGSL